MKPIGFLVMDTCEDWEQALCLRKNPDLPTGGILWWRDGANVNGAIFRDRKSAREAIQRTEHYRLAFGRTDIPEKQFCKIVPVNFVETAGQETQG
jgi:hypothetical protein